MTDPHDRAPDDQAEEPLEPIDDDVDEKAEPIDDADVDAIDEELLDEADEDETLAEADDADEADEVRAESDEADIDDYDAAVREVAGEPVPPPVAPAKRPTSAERRATAAPAKGRAPSPSEIAVHVREDVSKYYVIATVAVFSLILLNAILLGTAGLLRPLPTASPEPSASASDAPSGSPSAVPSVSPSAAPSASPSVAPSASPASSAS